jgi:hypothetical protein
MSAATTCGGSPPIGHGPKERRMATRQIKMPVKDNSEQEVEEVFSQRPNAADICSKSTGKRRAPTRPPKPLKRLLCSSKRIIRSCWCRSTTASITRTRWSRRRPPNHDEVPHLPWVTLEPLVLSLAKSTATGEARFRLRDCEKKPGCESQRARYYRWASTVDLLTPLCTRYVPHRHLL